MQIVRLGGPTRQQSQLSCSPQTACGVARPVFQWYVPPSCFASPPPSQPALVSLPGSGQYTQHVSLREPLGPWGPLELEEDSEEATKKSSTVVAMLPTGDPLPLLHAVLLSIMGCCVRRRPGER